MSIEETKTNYTFDVWDIRICRYDDEYNPELNPDGSPKLYRISNDHLYDVIRETANDVEYQELMAMEITEVREKLYIMCHKMSPEDKWVVRCPYKWLEQNNKERVSDGEEPERIQEFSWVESEVSNG